MAHRVTRSEGMKENSALKYKKKKKKKKKGLKKQQQPKTKTTTTTTKAGGSGSSDHGKGRKGLPVSNILRNER